MGNKQVAAIPESELDHERVRDQIHTNEATMISTQAESALIFQEVAFHRSHQNDVSMQVDEWSLPPAPREVRLLQLQTELTTATALVQAYQTDMRDIIDLGGDFSAEELENLRTFAHGMVTLQISNPENAGPALKDLNEIAARNGISLNVSEGLATHFNLSTAFSEFSVSVLKPSTEELELKETIEYQHILLQMYQKMYRKKELKGYRLKIACKVTSQGIPFIIRSETYVKQGFSGLVDGKFQINQIHIIYSDGSVFDGQSIDGLTIGTGSLPTSSRGVFTGTIFDSMRAEGKISNKNTVLRGTFKLLKKNDTITFTPSGFFQSFEDGKLERETTTRFDGSMSGWVKSASYKLCGEWNSDGDFVSGSIRTTDRKYKGNFKDYSLEGLGKTSYKDLTCEGAFKNGKLNGPGTVTIGRTRIEGLFYNNKPHGECILIDDDHRFQGAFVHGVKNGHGTLTTLDFSYNGEFANGKMHGKGTYQTSEFKYTGDFVRGKFEGKGKLREADCVYSGQFAHNKFNGHGTLTRADGAKVVGIFKDDKLIKEL